MTTDIYYVVTTTTTKLVIVKENENLAEAMNNPARVVGSPKEEVTTEYAGANTYEEAN